MAPLELLTVRELVQETDLGLVLITGPEGLDRVVRGIHLSDLEDPTPFMTPGMVLLTTGQAFAASPAAGMRLLNRLSALDVAALGVGIGHFFEHVAPEISARARELRTPIFEAPLSVPFRTITSYVYDALASSDMHRLRRSLAVQGHLLDLMLERRPLAQLVAELSGILEVEVMLFDGRGEVLARAGGDRSTDRPARLWRLLVRAEGDPQPLGVLETGSERIYVRRVVAYGVLEAVLVADGSGAASAEFMDTALSFAQRLLTLERLQESERLIVRRRMRSLLLDDFLSGHGSAEDFAARFREQGVSLDRPWRVAVFSIEDARQGARARDVGEKAAYEFKSRFLNTVDSYFSAHELPFLSMVKGDSVVALFVGGDAGPERAAAVLAAARSAIEHECAPAAVLVGCSGPTAGLQGAGRFYQEAMEALRMASDGAGVAGKLVLFDEAGGRFRLVEGQSVEALRAIHDRVVQPLRDYDREHRTCLVATLRAFVDSRLCPGPTAEALFVNRSTLRKRLRRIEELLGVDLRRMDDAVELHIALRASELLEARDSD
jgi:PucR family transcriptional regulator, purine catabolism regulatory protein